MRRAALPIAVLVTAAAVSSLVAACAESDFAGGSSASAPGKDEDDETDDDGDGDGDEDEAEGTDPDISADGTGTGTGTPVVDLGNTNTGINTQVDTGTSQPPAISLDTDRLECNRGKQGMTGRLFQLPQGTAQLPDFKTMTPSGQVEALTLDVPPRDWEDGFPGVPGLNEWFAIQFFALLDVPADGDYQFKTHSDDGSKVYIDEKLFVINDGQHSPLMSAPASVPLTKGKHKIVVEWFQGPKTEIALQVFWMPPGGQWAIIPAQVMTTATDCNLQVVGRFP